MLGRVSGGAHAYVAGPSPVGVRVRGCRIIGLKHLPVVSGFLKYFFREELNDLIGKPFKTFYII